MDRDEILKFLDSCERRLLESLHATQEALGQLDQLRRSFNDRNAGLEKATTLPDGHREEIVQAVLAAIGSPDAAAGRDLILLARNEEDRAYRIGRRRLNFTDTETQIMDLLWSAKPDPISRNDLHAKLYPGADKPNVGVIDVFISKLRQKLKLASNGREHLESIRGRGWVLRPDLYRADETA